MIDKISLQVPEDTKSWYIYKITNILNNKVYIGKSKNPINRLDTHIKNAKRKAGDCPKLENAISHHGEDNFKLEILSFTHDEYFSYEIENVFINEYDSIKNGMNCMESGLGAMSGDKHPMFGNGYKIAGDKNGMYGKTAELNPFFGQKHTPETIEYLRQINIGKHEKDKNYFWGVSLNGEKHGNCKTKENKAKEIIMLIFKGFSIKEIFEKTKVSKAVIANIKYNKNWKWLYRPYILEKVSYIDKYGTKRISTNVILKSQAFQE